MINNRQAGRRRGRGNNSGGGGGNGQRQGGQGRSDNGNRIDNRARGNASQLYEKYKNMAADAQRQGDRVNTEYYLQFADHYFRVLSDQRGRFEDQPQRRQSFDSDNDGDEDFGDEGEPIRSGEQAEAPRQSDAPRQNEYARQGDNGRQGDPARQGENGRQGDAPRQDRQPRGDRPQRRWDREPRRDTGEATAPVEVGGQHRADPIGSDEDLPARAESVIAADAPLAAEAPRRRGRPRRDAAPVETPASGANGFEADRLPPSLGATIASNAASSDDDDAPKPRRRRPRATAATEAVAD